MNNREPNPNPWLSTTPYQVPRHPVPVDLKLDSNEGKPLHSRILKCLENINIELLSRYPKPSTLESILAQQFNIDGDRVLLTAGGDDGGLAGGPHVPERAPRLGPHTHRPAGWGLPERVRPGLWARPQAGDLSARVGHSARA